MIRTREDLRDYIHADRIRQPIKYPLLAAVTFSESYLVRKYLTVLRHYEYYLNKWQAIKDKGSVHAVLMGGCFSCMFCTSLDGGGYV